jgi:hypothetical protein
MVNSMFRTTIAALLAAQVASVTQAPRPTVSEAEAASLARKLETLGSPRTAKDDSVLVTESELNSYVNLQVLPTLDATVRDVEVKLEPGRVRASGFVDIDDIKERLSLSPWNPVSFLSGQMPVTISGRYAEPRAGYGQVAIEEVRAGRVPIPVSILEQLIASSTRTKAEPDGFDLQAPFRLPAPVRRVRLMLGRAFLDL